MHTGIYEQLINETIKRQLSTLEQEKFYISNKQLDVEEAAIYLSQYIVSIVQFALQHLKKDECITTGIGLINDIILLIRDRLKIDELDSNLLDIQGQFLTAIIDKTQCNYPDIAQYLKSITPYTRLTQSELFTGANQSISLESELKREIASADEICFLVSFIKWSGIRIFEKELREFAHQGKIIRIIATSYMGATDLKAIQFLASLPHAEVKISYNTSNERLHAKAYLFLRQSGFDTGYIGSSNLSHAALTNGLEWNLKITTAEIPQVLDKFHKTFESYWVNNEFETFHLGEDDQRLQHSLQHQNITTSIDYSTFFDLRPYPFQQEILDRLSTERTLHHRFRNLIVAATGTGKTMISAFDYQRYKAQTGGAARLLFIAHRKEILQQAQACFRGILRDHNFGELWVNGNKPTNYEHVFASVASLNNQLDEISLSEDYYNFIIIDEVHHIAASSYRPLLERFSPKILLGLTATPERMDGQDILPDFCDKIAAEIRLPEALNRKLLCPFQYFGITDTTDISRVSWNNGQYDSTELTQIYNKDQRVCQVLSAMQNYLTDPNDVRALCFCVSIEHAEYMAQKFSDSGLKAKALTATTSPALREEVRKELENKQINYLFVVDVFNEGIDIPAIDTVLFLRPTESLTIFLQQLGRGLRLYPDKECLTALDFVGNARAEFDYESRFRALMGRTNTSVKDEIESEFIHLPIGCSIVLEKVAQHYILENIKNQANFNHNKLIQRIRNFKYESNLELTLSNFIQITHIPLRKIYSRTDETWTTLCIEAGVISTQEMGYTRELSRAIRKKWLSCNSFSYFSFIQTLCHRKFDLQASTLTAEEKLMVTMFYYDLFQNADVFNSLQRMFDTLAQHPYLISELQEVMNLLCEQTQALELPFQSDFPCPLRLHARYTREQIQAALQLSTLIKKSSGREGVERNKQLNVEIMYVDLNKTDKDYSPSTLYKDYALNETLFHWQSQNSVNENTPTGQAYIHETQCMLLFVREQKRDEYRNTMGYIFLGEVKYLSHDGGNPMNIRWQLQTPIPASLWKFAGKLTGN